MDHKIGWRLLAGLRGISPGNAAGLHAGAPAGHDVDCRIADHPCLIDVPVRVGKNLEDADRVRLLPFETVTPVHGGEVAQDAESLEHNSAETDRLVCQDSQPAVRETPERRGNTRIQNTL